MKKLFNVEGDIKEVFHHDNHDDKSYISQHQDVTPYLKAAHNARSNRGEHSSYQSETLNHKANIPDTVYLAWCRTNGVSLEDFFGDDKIFRRFMNDPDTKPFLYIPGKI